MKAVALLTVYVGYVVLAYGLNHVTGGCVSFKQTAFPSSTPVTDPCSSAKAPSASGGANAYTGQAATDTGTTPTSNRQSVIRTSPGSRTQINIVR